MCIRKKQKMKRIRTYQTLLLLTISSFSFGQFDLLNLDPVSTNPSYVGSSGKNRITLYLYPTLYETTFNTRINYDLFSNKLKGAWGISAESSIASPEFKGYDFDFAYSPKITSRRGKLTFAPGFKVSYSDLKIDSVGFNYDYNGFDYTFALNVNSDHSLIGAFFNLKPKTSDIITQVQYVHQFNRDKESTKSSTFSGILQFNKQDPILSFLTTPNSHLPASGDYKALNLYLSYGIKRRRLLIRFDERIGLWNNNSLPKEPLTVLNFIPKVSFGHYGKRIQILASIGLEAGVVKKF